MMLNDAYTFTTFVEICCDKFGWLQTNLLQIKVMSPEAESLEVVDRGHGEYMIVTAGSGLITDRAPRIR